MSPLLTVSDLSKTFTIHALGRTVRALASIHLSLRQGSHLVLAGPSGSGKSTLVKCVNRTNLIDGGQITFRAASGELVDLGTVADTVMADLRDAEIGYVSQFLRAEPRRTARQVVAKAARRRALDRDRAGEAADRALEEVGLPRRLWDSYPALMSGGEQQRVNLAAAIVVPPRLLLLDEPVASLDPGGARQALRVVERLREEGVSILSVFHQRSMAERLADEVAVLDGGRLVDLGPPARVRWPEGD